MVLLVVVVFLWFIDYWGWLNMNRKFFVSVFMVLCVISSLYGFDVTVTPDREEFRVGETALVELETQTGNEKLQIYTLDRRNSTGDIIESRSGVTSDILDGIVTESFSLNDSALGRNEFNVTGVNLEGGDFINVSNTTANLILIPKCTFTSPEILLGRTLGVKCDIQDGSGNDLNDADVIFAFLDSDNVPIVELENVFKSVVGKAGASLVLGQDKFIDENTTYILAVAANCGLTNETGCFDKDGNPVLASQGSATFAFFVNQWLNVETNVSTTSLSIGDFFTICANITQPENRSRLLINVDYKWRVFSNDVSNNRILIESAQELREIPTNITQTQCKRFVVPENSIIERGATNWYASTHVEVLNEKNEHITHYNTRSINGIVIIDDIHPGNRFVRQSQYVYNSIINTSDFDVGVVDIDIILPELLSDFPVATRIKSFTVTFINDSSIPFDTELYVHKDDLSEDGGILDVQEVEIRIKNVDSNSDFVFTVIIEMEPTLVGDVMFRLLVIFTLLALLAEWRRHIVLLGLTAIFAFAVSFNEATTPFFRVSGTDIQSSFNSSVFIIVFAAVGLYYLGRIMFPIKDPIINQDQ